MALLLYNQQQAIKKISSNNAARYEQIAQEVEDSELAKLLGFPLLYDLQTNATTIANKALLEGAEFKNCQGQKIKHKGLYFVIAYLNYAKYCKEVGFEDTFTGLVKKNRQESESITDGELRRIVEGAQSIAMTQFEIVKEYLNANKSIYPLWCASASVKPNKLVVHGIKKTLL